TRRCEPCVLMRHDAFENQLAAHRVAQTLDEVPGHVRGEHGAHSRHVEPIVVGLAGNVAPSGCMARSALPCVGSAQSQKCLLVSAPEVVEGHNDGGAAGTLCALDQGFGNLPLW